jgi:hypothetical protein
MPLRDHFHSPVNDTHSWDEVHGGWPMEIVRELKPILPTGFRAAPQVHLGSPFEVDVSTYDLSQSTSSFPRMLKQQHRHEAVAGAVRLE